MDKFNPAFEDEGFFNTGRVIMISFLGLIVLLFGKY